MTEQKLKIGLYADTGVAPNSYLQLKHHLSDSYTITKLKSSDIIGLMCHTIKNYKGRVLLILERLLKTGAFILEFALAVILRAEKFILPAMMVQ